MSSTNWMEILFRPGQLVGFKQELYDKPTTNPSSQFYILNPIRSLANASDANVLVLQNILIELDWKTIKAQEKLIERDLNIPFTMKTFSGGKSLHYVISLDQPVDRAKYDYIVELLHFIIKVADVRCKNPARLTRTPGATRIEKSAVQTLLHLEAAPLVTDQFLSYLDDRFSIYQEALKEETERRRAAYEAQAKEVSITSEPPAWIKRIMADPANEVPQGRRHETLVSMAVTLYTHGFSVENAIAPILSEVASVVGKSPADVDRIINWTVKNIIPLDDARD